MEVTNEVAAPVKKVSFLGVKIAFVVAGLLIVAGLADPANKGDLMVSGLIALFGSLAYFSAKKRKYSVNPVNSARTIMELILIFSIVAATVLPFSTLSNRAYDNPFANIFIPLWVIIAYFVIALRIKD